MPPRSTNRSMVRRPELVRRVRSPDLLCARAISAGKAISRLPNTKAFSVLFRTLPRRRPESWSDGHRAESRMECLRAFCVRVVLRRLTPIEHAVVAHHAYVAKPRALL